MYEWTRSSHGVTPCVLHGVVAVLLLCFACGDSTDEPSTGDTGANDAAATDTGLGPLPDVPLDFVTTPRPAVEDPCVEGDTWTGPWCDPLTSVVWTSCSCGERFGSGVQWQCNSTGTITCSTHADCAAAFENQPYCVVGDDRLVCGCAPPP